MRLSIATYNIHSCVGSDGRYDPDRTLDVLREIDADVIALQEVDSREHKGLELLACLAHESGFEAIPGPTLLRQTGRFGNAILTRLKIRETRRLDLTYSGREPRGAIDVELECEDIRLQVIATHLGLKPAERRRQVKQLLDRFETKHCVLLGDLNEWFLWGRPLRWLQAIFGKMPAPMTFPARYPILALDRIWVRPIESLVALQVHATSLSRIASDHLPLKAVIECDPRPDSETP